VLVFDTLSTVGESVVKGLERMEWVLAVRFPGNLIRVVLSLAALALGWGLISVFWMSGVFQVIMLVLYGLLLLRWQRPARHLFSRAMSSQIARTSLVFLGISVFSVGFRYLDVIILSKVTSAQEVGVYSAARKVADMVLMMSPAVMVALFPFLSRAYVASRERMADVVAQALKLLVVLLLPIGLVMCALAGPLIHLFYGEAEFEQAVSLLRILAWAVPVFFASNLLFRVLLSSDREKLTLRVSAWNAAFNLVLNLLLIPLLGATGSCLAFVATALLAFLQNYFYVRRQLFSLDLLRTVGYPLLSLLGAVGAYLLVARESPLPGLIASGLVYCGLLIITKTITRREWGYVIQTWHGLTAGRA
jgi:O-antigen/teichoic acid export membrane protein